MRFGKVVLSITVPYSWLRSFTILIPFSIFADEQGFLVKVFGHFYITLPQTRFVCLCLNQPSSLSGTSSFILLWYSSIFPYLYFMVFLISICFKWLSNTYLTESSTAVIRYSSWFLTYAVIYDGRSRLIQMMKGNNSKYNKLQLLIPRLSRSYHSRLT